MTNILLEDLHVWINFRPHASPTCLATSSVVFCMQMMSASCYLKSFATASVWSLFPSALKDIRRIMPGNLLIGAGLKLPKRFPGKNTIHCMIFLRKLVTTLLGERGLLLPGNGAAF